MYGGISPQAYDRAITVFSPDGRLFQVEYAKEAVKRGSTAVGLVAKDAVVLAAMRSFYSPLVVEDSAKKINIVDDNIMVTTSGLIADARRLIDLAREQAQKHNMLYSSKPPVIYVAKYIADIMQLYTQYGGGRPFGVSLLMAGFDQQPHLYEIEPSGALTGYKANSIGEGKKEVDAFFEKNYKEGMELKKALKMAAKALSLSSNHKLKPSSVEMVYLTSKSKSLHYLNEKEKARLL